ncbi:MAG TPA: ankyrin repeat domain-containing protein [Nitrospira sp.]|nr:ankyrin repeat domain-containing protein [Nitrospira sp.]
MKYRYTRTAWAVAILLLFIGAASIAGTYICSDPDGNEVYTDHNRRGCREFTPTPPNDIEGKPSAKPPLTRPKRSQPAPVPLKPLGEQKPAANTVQDDKGTNYSEQDLLRAIASGNKEKTGLVLRAGISPNAKDEQGRSALTMAAALPSTEIPRLLMTYGADVNSRSNDGTTPLMAAMMAGQKDTAGLLLRNGADVNASALLGSPAPQQMPMLFVAIAIGDVEIAKVLIEGGADLNAMLSEDAQMLTPLTFALKTNQQDIARLLMATKKTPGPLQAHIRQLEGRLTALCKDAGEKIYEVADNVEGIYFHVPINNAGKAFGYYHEKDRLSSSYLSPTSGRNYRFWEMDAAGKAGVIYHQRIKPYPLGKPGDQMIELKQVALPVAVYGITWRPLTGTEDQRQGLYGDELKIFEVKTERVLAVRTVFFYAITETTVNASGDTLPIPDGQKPYRFATCTNYNPGPDDAYPDLRPRDSYRFVSKVLHPK